MTTSGKFSGRCALVVDSERRRLKARGITTSIQQTRNNNENCQFRRRDLLRTNFSLDQGRYMKMETDLEENKPQPCNINNKKSIQLSAKHHENIAREIEVCR